MTSRSSSSPAAKTLTRLLAVRGYAKLGQMPPGTPFTKLQTLYFNRHLWHIKATPCGFVDGVPGAIAVHVSTVTYNRNAPGTTISIEILDGATLERAVFRAEQVLGDHAWSKHLMVDRSALEAAGCVRDDYVPVRITLTFFDKKEHQRLQRAVARAEWCRRLKRSFFDFQGSNLMNLNLNLGLVLPMCHSLNAEKVRPGPVTFLDTRQQHQPEEKKKMTTMVEKIATIKSFRYMYTTRSVLLETNKSDKAEAADNIVRGIDTPNLQFVRAGLSSFTRTAGFGWYQVPQYALQSVLSLGRFTHSIADFMGT